MRALVLIIAIAAAPQIAAAGNASVVAQPVENFRTLAPHAEVQNGGTLVEGGYCRQTRFAARPNTVRIVKIDANGAETISVIARVRGAIGHRSQGCGFYTARLAGTPGAGETIQVRPVS